MAEPTQRRATYQDVLAAARHEVAEILDGTLYLSPRPALPHASVASVLGSELMPPFHRGRGGPGGWIILYEPELHLGDDIVVPDLAGWRRDRLPAIEQAAYLTLPPDWLCEVLSRSTEKIDRAKKLPIYAAAGVHHAWLINPTLRTLEVLRLCDGRWRTVAVHCDGQRFRAEPFEVLELELGTLWADFAPAGRACEPTAVYGEQPAL
jgi:Uma2 family endonuclease